LATTVRFSDAVSAGSASEVSPAAVLAPLLRDRARLSLPPDQRLLALFVRGYSAHLSTAAVLGYVRSRDDALRAALDESPGLARSVSSAARRWLRDVRGDDAAVRLRREVARRGLARLLSPTPEGLKVSARADATTRAVFAHMVSRWVELATDGKNALIYSPAWAGVQVNLSARQVTRALSHLEKEYRWIRRAGSAGGGRILWRLTQLNDPFLRETAWAVADAIDALADGQPERDAVAATLLTAGHHAWHYSKELGSRAFLTLVAHHAGPGMTAGVSVTSLRTARKALDAYGLRTVAAEALPARLDTIGEETLAVFIRADREVAHAAEVEETRRKLAEFRAKRDAQYEARKRARAFLRQVHEHVGKVPAAADGKQALEQWVPRLAAVLAGRVAASAVDAVVAELETALVRAGHEQPVVAKVVGFVRARTTEAATAAA